MLRPKGGRFHTPSLHCHATAYAGSGRRGRSYVLVPLPKGLEAQCADAVFRIAAILTEDRTWHPFAGVRVLCV